MDAVRLWRSARKNTRRRGRCADITVGAARAVAGLCAALAPKQCGVAACRLTPEFGIELLCRGNIGLAGSLVALAEFCDATPVQGIGKGGLHPARLVKIRDGAIEITA